MIGRRSESLRAVLDDPRANLFVRGIVHFILGDVESGVADWRRAREDPAHSKAPSFTAYNENAYFAAVANDRRYEESLEDGGIGRRWRAYLRESNAELAPITGSEPGDPTPQRVYLR